MVLVRITRWTSPAPVEAEPVVEPSRVRFKSDRLRESLLGSIRNTDLLAPSSEPPEPAPEPVFVVPEAPPPPEPEPEPEPLSVYPSRFLRSSGNDFL